VTSEASSSWAGQLIAAVIMQRLSLDIIQVQNLIFLLPKNIIFQYGFFFWPLGAAVALAPC
jgi:hypothetical protein